MFSPNSQLMNAPANHQWTRLVAKQFTISITQMSLKLIFLCISSNCVLTVINESIYTFHVRANLSRHESF